MTVEEQLRNQDWARILAILTPFAWKRTGKRSWEHAQDLAQHAIADAFERIDGWDPAKEPLLKNLSRRVCGLASNSWRRKRNTFEIAMGDVARSFGDDGTEDDEPAEIDAPSDADPIDEVLDRKRIAAMFHRRLVARLAGDEEALQIVTLLMNGEKVPAESKATGPTASPIAAARRRLFRHAEAVSKELALELDSEETSEVIS